MESESRSRWTCGTCTARLARCSRARWGAGSGPPADPITVRCTGSAGQSFGAFAARGVTLELEGEANDYVGKGLSGGRLVVRAPQGAHFIPDETVIVGNT